MRLVVNDPLILASYTVYIHTARTITARKLLTSYCSSEFVAFSLMSGGQLPLVPSHERGLFPSGIHGDLMFVVSIVVNAEQFGIRGCAARGSGRAR